MIIAYLTSNPQFNISNISYIFITSAEEQTVAQPMSMLGDITTMLDKRPNGLTTEYRATFEGLSFSSGSSARQLISRYIIQMAQSSARQSVLTSYHQRDPSEVFGPPKVIIIMPQVYALPYNAHTERYIYTFN